MTKSSTPRTPTAEMPFLDHLEELRWRIIWSLVAVGVTVGLSFWALVQFDVIKILSRPILPYLPPGQKLVYTHPTDSFMIYMTLSIVLGVIAASPVVVYQAWAFLSPALHKHEKKLVVPVAIGAAILFICGVSLSYFGVMPLALQWLLNFQSSSLQPMISVHEYFDFLFTMSLAFGIAFELPIVILVLTALGLVSPMFLRKYRRHAIVLCVFVGAFLTPGDLVWTTLAMAVPLYVLYELSILLSTVVYRRQQTGRRRRAAKAPDHRVKGIEALAAAALLAAVAPTWVAAQQPGQPPPNIPQQYPNNPNARRVNRDSVRADSLRKLYAADTIKHTVHWIEADSMTNLLLDKDGYSHTRYQGRQAHLDADTHELQIEGERGINVGRAAVDRDTTVIIGNTIRYNDSTQLVYAKGDTIVLHDPSSNESDVFSYQSLTYDVAAHTARVTSLSTDYTQSGQQWFIQAEKAAYVGDTVKGKNGGHNIFYGRSGDITTCDDSFPHYHIRGGELKYVSKQVLVIRPAVLYIADVPILWLPFMFQDLRRGRRSGILTPRFGFTELLRNSPTYRRHVENVGYYFVMGQYADLTTWLDWRSGARADVGDPGFTQYNGEFRYRWLDRFLDGDIAINHRDQQDGSTNTALYWNHRQDFSLHSHLQLNINYVTSTVVQQNAYLNPYSALANINSTLNYQQDIGPASMSLGGTQTQYPGQTRLDRTFPTLSITSKPVSAGTWLTWSPSFSATNSQSYGLDQPGDFAYLYGVTQQGQLDSTLRNRDTRNSSASFDTPLKIFGFNLRNSFRVRDQYNNYPVNDVIFVPTKINGRDTTVSTTRTYRTSYATALDWDTGIDLPSIFQGSWNIVPSVSVVNADGQAPFLQRTELSGDSWVSQSKNLVYGLSISPTLFGLFPGFLGISRFRHSITPTLTFDYAAPAHTSQAFLLANGQNPVGYLGNLAQESATLGLSTNIEAKFRDGPDTAPDNGTKIKLLSINFDPITWDFARAAATHHTGLTNTSFGWDVRTDMLPGLDFRESYSLFQGNPESDTAVFKPYLTLTSASVSFGSNSHILDPFKKLLGIKVEKKQPDSLAGRDPFFQQQVQAGHVAGQGAQYAQYAIPTVGQGWNVSLTYTANQQRPPVGNLSNLITYNPAQVCAQFQFTDPNLYALCIYEKQHAIVPDTTGLLNNCTTQACPQVLIPPQRSLAGSLSFNLTPRWSAQWQTTYDFTRHNFASQVVTLQRDLHDWKAVFSFTQSPTGSFGFTFFVALKAEPALKFNYDRTSYRAPPGSGF